MSTKYRCKKQVTRLMAGFSQFLAILMSKLRSSLEAAWSMARVCLEAAYSEITARHVPAPNCRGAIPLCDEGTDYRRNVLYQNW